MTVTASFAPLATHQDTYNALDDVIDADARLDVLGREDTLDALMTVIEDHGLPEHVGIRLLHRHCDISTGEIMLESEETGADDVPQLTTAPAGMADGLVPNSWMLINGHWHPAEFSTEARLQASAEVLRAAPEFLDAFADRLLALGADKTLGLCLIQRDFFRFGTPDTMLLEESDDLRRANVLRFEPESEDAEFQTVQTVWVSNKAEITASCPLCGFKCKISMGCKEYSDGHRKTEVLHSRTHRPGHS